MNLLYKNLTELIRDNLDNSKVKEANNSIKNLIKQLEDVKQKGFFTKEQFYKVVMWKSPRPKKYYLSNSEEMIKKISRKVLSTTSEESKIELLDSFKGVSIPVASAILTIIDPVNYGVIDIRVWQLLYLYGEVKIKPRGQGFMVADWLEYLTILRKYAFEFKIRARDLEIILFFYHKKIQEGNLYK